VIAFARSFYMEIHENVTKSLRIETGDKHDTKVEKTNRQVEKRWENVIILLKMEI
jgi:hypothetical protein